MCLIIIQIRNGSNRLPFKSSLSIAGKPNLLHIINRLKKIINKDFRIIVATTKNHIDQPIVDLCSLNKIQCFRGDPLNVFSRYQYLVNKYQPSKVIRITGDCPLLFTPLIYQLLEIMNNDNNIDYASNTIKRTFPHGFDIEIFKSEVILNKKNPSELDKEHVTPFIYNSGIYKTYSFESKDDLSDIRITLDTFKDYLLIDKILQKWISESKDNNVYDILDGQSISRIIYNNDDIKKLHEDSKLNNI